MTTFFRFFIIIAVAFTFSCNSSGSNAPSSTIQKSDSIHFLSIQQKASADAKDMDQVLKIGERIRSIAIKKGDSLAIAESIILVKGDVDYNEQMKIFPHLPSAIETFQQHHLIYKEGLARSMYGTMLISKGALSDAQKQLMAAYDIFDKLDSTRAKFAACVNIGNTYSEFKSVKESFKYYREAFMIAENLNDSIRIASSALNIGLLFKDNHLSIDSALYYLEYAKKHLPIHAGILKSKVEYDIASILADKGQLEEAKIIYQNILDVFLKVGMTEGIAMAHKGLGEVAYKQKDFAVSIDHFNTSLQILDTLGMQLMVQGILPFMSDAYIHLGDYKKAYDIELKMNSIGDSLFTIEKHNAVKEIESKYQAEKKEFEISEWKKDNQIKKAILIGLVIILVIIIYLYRKKNILMKERTLAYDALMQKFREKKQERTKPISTIEAEPVPVPKTLYDKIVEYYIAEKPYLNPKLRVEDIAQQLHCNQKDIAAALREAKFSNFNAFTNKYRVETARLMFEDPAFENFKMEAIALKSGFGSIQSFYNAFELFTGIKPAYYRNNV